MILSGAADRVWPMWQTGLFCYALLARRGHRLRGRRDRSRPEGIPFREFTPSGGWYPAISSGRGCGRVSSFESERRSRPARDGAGGVERTGSGGAARTPRAEPAAAAARQDARRRFPRTVQEPVRLSAADRGGDLARTGPYDRCRVYRRRAAAQRVDRHLSGMAGRDAGAGAEGADRGRGLGAARRAPAAAAVRAVWCPAMSCRSRAASGSPPICA